MFKKDKIKEPIMIILGSIIIIPFLILFLFMTHRLYSGSLSESARMSRKFSSKLEKEVLQNKEIISLNDLVDFEWDTVCFFNDNETIDLSDKFLTEQIGFMPEEPILSKVEDDVTAILFTDSRTKKTTILGYVYALNLDKNQSNHYFVLEPKSSNTNFVTIENGYINASHSCYKKEQNPTFKKYLKN